MEFAGPLAGELPGIGHNPDALGEYFASWEGRMTHVDAKTGSQVAYDAVNGNMVVDNSYMIHGYQMSADAFNGAQFKGPGGSMIPRYVRR